MASREYDSTGSHLPKIPRKLKTLFKEALANLPATVYKHFGPAAQATVITEADVKELYPAFQGDFEFSSGSNTFLDICKAASHRLKLVNERFRGQFQVLNEEELRKTDEQFRKRKILISTFGRHNSGKSTLLNAILEFRLLPTQWKSETSLVVYIKHDSRRTHRDKCDSPVLRLEKPEPDRFSRSMTVSHKDKLGEHVNSRGHCDSFVLVEEPEPQCFLQSTRIPHKDNLGEHVNSSGQVEERGHESKTAGTPRSFPRSGLQSPPPVRIPPVLSSLRHGRVCQACPMLRITNQESNVEEVTGTSAVRKKLKSLNTTIRSSVTQSHSARKPATGKSIRHRRDVKERPVHKQPLLASTGSGDSTDKVTTRGDIKCAALVNVPLLSSAPAGWDVFLVDTPGYGEHHQEIAAAAEAILKESSAFVYVMDYNVIGGEADANYLRQLYEHDKEVFNNDRLVIAVTKFDQKFQAEDSDDEGDQSDQSRETIKAIVSEQVAELFHVKPKDIVIPISAKNAYRARQLKHSLGDSEQKKKVIEAIAQYPTQPCGQGENRDKHLQTFTSEELVQKLEELSGILELEKRVRMMTRRSVKIWITKMKTDYASYLKTAAKKLEEVLTDTKGRLDGKQKLHGEANREYGEVATIRESLKKSTEEGSAVYETLLQAYDNDMEVVNPTQTVKERVLQMIAGFKEKCLKRMEAEEDAYGANELQQDATVITEADVKELYPAFQEDFEFRSGSNTFLDICKASSHRLKLVNERFHGQFQVLNEEELRKTDEQFEKRKILISTFGRHNSGKSTLLNAILEFRLLPTNWLSETSLVVYIQHDSSRTHRGKCVCPVLEEPEQRFSRSMSLSSSYEDKHIKVGSPAEERGRVSNRQDGSLPLFQSRTLNSPRSQRSHPTASLRHGWVCQACPMLRITREDSNVEEVSGTNDVHTKLKDLNDAIRRTATQSLSARKPVSVESMRRRRGPAQGDIKCTALVNVPLLSSAPAGWDVVLVDTPGYGEHHQEIAAAAEATLIESSAFVYMMEYSAIGGEADSNYLRQLYEHDKDIFTNDRLVIAVTKIDQKFQAGNPDSEDESQSDESREIIKQIVSDQVTQWFDVKPKDIVIPISGVSANYARQLEHSPGDDSKRKIVIKAIAQYPTQPCGQGESREEYLQKLTSEELVQKLEELSGILELEERVQMMTRKSVKIWIAKMKTDYASYLKTATRKLEEVLVLTQEKLGDKLKLHEDAIRKYDEVATIREGLKKSTEEGSAVYETLLQAYDNDMEDVNPTQTVKERVPQMIAGFKEKCLKRMEAEGDAYGANELQQDMKVFSQVTTEELEAVLDRDCKYPKVNKALLDVVEKMSGKCSDLRCKADVLCNLLPLPTEKLSPPTLPPREGDRSISASDMSEIPIDHTATTGGSASDEQLDDTDDEEINALPGVPNDLGAARRKWGGIPKLKLSWRRFLQFLKSMVSWKSTPEGSKETQRGIDKQALDNELVKLEHEILDDCDSHFQEIKAPIVKRFYEQYRDRTVDKMKSFDEEFQHRIKLRRQRIVKLQDDIDELSLKTEELSALCFHLPLLCDFLEKVADTALDYYS